MQHHVTLVALKVSWYLYYVASSISHGVEYYFLDCGVQAQYFIFFNP